MAKNMSFLPEDYLEKRVAQRTNIICASLFVVVMICVVTAFFVTNRQRNDMKAQQDAINARFEQAALQLEQLEKMQSQQTQMLRKAKVTAVLVERVPRSLILAELINHMPTTLSLLEFNLETKVLRTTSRARTAMQRARENLAEKAADPDSKPPLPATKMTVDLIGVAPTDVEVAQYMTALSTHPMFMDVSLLYSEESNIDDRKARKFRINIVINGDVNVNELNPTRVARELNMNPMGKTLHIDGSGLLDSGPEHVEAVRQNTSQTRRGQ